MKKFLFLLLFSISLFAQPKTIHVFVALCDNDSQGIVPVSKMLGNGNDPANNLYWGAMYGLKTFLKRSGNWTLLHSEKNTNNIILENCVFKHKKSSTYLVADAYKGSKIKLALKNFLKAASGNNIKLKKIDKKNLKVNGGADLIAYIGHNGLMDFNIPKINQSKKGNNKDVIVLSCKSKPYFEDRLKKLGCNFMLLTTGFMAPEAYTLEAAVEGWISNEKPEQIRVRADQAYNKYQKCGLRGATRLFYTK